MSKYDYYLNKGDDFDWAGPIYKGLSDIAEAAGDDYSLESVQEQHYRRHMDSREYPFLGGSLPMLTIVSGANNPGWSVPDDERWCEMALTRRLGTTSLRARSCRPAPPHSSLDPLPTVPTRAAYVHVLLAVYNSVLILGVDRESRTTTTSTSSLERSPMPIVPSSAGSKNDSL